MKVLDDAILINTDEKPFKMNLKNLQKLFPGLQKFTSPGQEGYQVYGGIFKPVIGFRGSLFGVIFEYRGEEYLRIKLFYGDEVIGRGMLVLLEEFDNALLYGDEYVRDPSRQSQIYKGEMEVRGSQMFGGQRKSAGVNR